MAQNAKELRILLAEDHPLFSRAVQSAAKEYPQFEHLTFTPVRSVKGARETVAANDFDAAMLDVGLLDDPLGGFTLARELSPKLPVLIVSTFSNDDIVVARAKRAGALAFVSKTAEPHVIYGLLVDLCAGKIVDGFALDEEILKKRKSFEAALTTRHKRMLREFCDAYIAENEQVASVVDRMASAMRRKINGVRVDLQDLRDGIRDKLGFEVPTYAALAKLADNFCYFSTPMKD